MIDPLLATQPLLRSVLHPTDFAEGSEVALAHAIRLALAARARLEEPSHAEPDNIAVPASRFPDVVATLIRWGLLLRLKEKHLATVGCAWTACSRSSDAPVASIVAELEASHSGLVVMATHNRHGFRRLLEPSVTEPTVREGRTRTLVECRRNAGVSCPWTTGRTTCSGS